MGLFDKFFDKVEDALEDLTDKVADVAKEAAKNAAKQSGNTSSSSKTSTTSSKKTTSSKPATTASTKPSIDYKKLAVHVDDAQEALRELAALTAEIKALNNRAEACRAAFGAGWQGSSGELMQDKLREWSGEQTSIARNLENTHGQLRNFLNTLVNRDQELARMIRNM